METTAQFQANKEKILKAVSVPPKNNEAIEKLVRHMEHAPISPADIAEIAEIDTYLLAQIIIGGAGITTHCGLHIVCSKIGEGWDDLILSVAERGEYDPYLYGHLRMVYSISEMRGNKAARENAKALSSGISETPLKFDVSAEIEKGNYSVYEQAGCGCSISFDIDENEGLIETSDCDACYCGIAVHIANLPVFALDTDGGDVIGYPLINSMKDSDFDFSMLQRELSAQGVFVPAYDARKNGHQQNREDALRQRLTEFSKTGNVLYCIRYYSNKYTLIVGDAFDEDGVILDEFDHDASNASLDSFSIEEFVRLHFQESDDATEIYKSVAVGRLF